MTDELTVEKRGALRVGFRDYPVYQVAREDLERLPLDLRLAAIGIQIEKRIILTTNMSAKELLMEEVVDSKSEVRRTIVSVMQE